MSECLPRVVTALAALAMIVAGCRGAPSAQGDATSTPLGPGDATSTPFGPGDATSTPFGLSEARSAESKPPTRVVKDAVGRDVRVPVRPKRIVSLAPAITETLFAAGAGDRVVGVTRFCNFPAAADALPEVGGFSDPDVERVAQLAPDLVIATADTVTRERFDALVSLGIPVFATDASDFAGVASAIRVVSDVAGNAAEGDAIAKDFEGRLEAVRAKVKDRKPRRTLFLFQADPAIAAGKGTFLDELVRTAGGENVAVSAPTSYPRLGLEGIIALAPEIVLTTMPQTAETLRRSLAGSPIAASRIVPVEADLVERPGPRLVAGLEQVAALLHPDAFPKDGK